MKQEIVELRKKIDKIDNQLADLLLERLKISREIISKKKSLGLPVYDEAREKEIYEEIEELFPNEKEYLKEIMEVILKYSKKDA